MNFTEHEIEECILLKHRIMKCLRQHTDDIGFSVLMTILMKSVTNDKNRKEDVMNALSQSWDQHMEYKNKKCECDEET